MKKINEGNEADESKREREKSWRNQMVERNKKGNRSN